MRHFEIEKLACLALFGILTQGLLACSDDSHPPPIGAPTMPIATPGPRTPVITEGGAGTGPVVGSGGALGSAGNGVLGNTGGDNTVTSFGGGGPSGGNGTTPPDPFGVGGNSSGNDPFGVGGGVATAVAGNSF